MERPFEPGFTNACQFPAVVFRFLERVDSLFHGDEHMAVGRGVRVLGDIRIPVPTRT
jgi:hypothetical protein